MDHYLDIHLLPDPEFAPHQLLAALYAKLHRALVQSAANGVAVSFPGYSESPPRLGTCLRLIGSAPDLEALMTQDWLRGMRDHIKVDAVAVVPADAVQRTLRRVQAKSSPARLRRRQMRRHGFSEVEAVQRVPDSAEERLDLPFVQLASGSTGQNFRLYLRLGAPQQSRSTGTFNTFGLSSTATIPCF
ncbi:MAG: type I-F CRISPR-associated endoribonuclease Cas6/Csy4 [Burkholderiales bacterium RIFCSPLOWO2_12_67_14]|nr:MAG: type I-F CRISPR-associated endoribonuclease Cas6/Csy4 [Burkholderiales bacterium RIFCSPLOWO2_02_FULL_67_64]OGB46365.1 MAG: type I-F CRISPR-associated endoribonuclease Cas6/Csy4 [Burkholderiales bacterium RIFCSPLOWO2_12_67_14]OGB49614.1 MAG: type I-F CRISPR-associated endoribonuclease Cas6/Csy4 [Burkholderiales bacterium RIFCSPHIGHO2_12_FULL_67_38]OGB81648.1 MAG: type I-F CRISPR-associated endoribonuclease Cas6/Csy4 [Burkholderiales bacterium RIFCSPLOWO2_12_FULL_67_210]